MSLFRYIPFRNKSNLFRISVDHSPHLNLLILPHSTFSLATPRNAQNQVFAKVPNGSPAGFYRVCTMVANANHSPHLFFCADVGSRRLLTISRSVKVAENAGTNNNAVDSSSSSSSSTTTTSTAAATTTAKAKGGKKTGKRESKMKEV